MSYPIEKVRLDFPILTQYVNNYPLIYLDSAASSQKPNDVILCSNNFYCKKYSSVHRGLYLLSNKATTYMENIRKNIANFINSNLNEEIVFIKGSTEGINLVVNSWCRCYLQFGDNILITEMEHHANIVPWQILIKEKKITLCYIPLLLEGIIDLSKLHFFINKNTRIFSITQLSNVLGILNPLLVLISIIRTLSNSIIVIDGAQGIIHQNIDMQILDCDFYVFSGHKFYGPSGIGILYGKKMLFDIMPPWEGGGSMINKVSLVEKIVIFNESPWRFEAGSPNIVGIIGLGAAFVYILKIGLINIHVYEYELMRYAIVMLFKIPGLRFYGLYDRIGVISFNIDKYHPYDISCFLDQYGIAIRTGHHCAMPLMNFYNVSGMCRISLAMYINFKDIDFLIKSLLRILFLFN
ncbi:MAG: SufS family cysteine desulfurase [gamma proteobacterium endosymbiont of Trioza apicalis]